MNIKKLTKVTIRKLQILLPNTFQRIYFQVSDILTDFTGDQYIKRFLIIKVINQITMKIVYLTGALAQEFVPLAGNAVDTEMSLPKLQNDLGDKLYDSQG